MVKGQLFNIGGFQFYNCLFGGEKFWELLRNRPLLSSYPELQTLFVVLPFLGKGKVDQAANGMYLYQFTRGTDLFIRVLKFFTSANYYVKI